MGKLIYYIQLSKPGMIFGLLICVILGYCAGFNPQNYFFLSDLLLLILGVCFLAAGTFALNQYQEHHLDFRMDRTKNRPIPSGNISPREALVFSFGCLLLSFFMLYQLSGLVLVLGVMVLTLYNGFYTLVWKPKMHLGAIPGAIPGALPVVLGYAAATNQILTKECIFLFLVMFAWQMPHFWALAIKYRNDYARGGIPVLPAMIGVEGTIYFIGTYLFLYVGIAFAAPLFIHHGYAYLFFVIPMGIKLIWEFRKLFVSMNGEKWFPFFMWVNASLLVFLISPVIDKFLQINQ